MSYTEKNQLKINNNLFKFINEEVIPGTNLNSDHFWEKFSEAVHFLAPKNKKLIEEREIIQKKLTSGTKEIKIKNSIRKII